MNMQKTSDNPAHLVMQSSRTPGRLLALAAVCAALVGVLGGCSASDADQAAPATAPPATDPLAVQTSPPEYPLELACAGIGGVVGLVLALDAEGVPGNVTLEYSSRQPALDAAAIAAVRGWRFKPATNRGQPVPTKIRVPVTFTPPTMRPERCFAIDEAQNR